MSKNRTPDLKIAVVDDSDLSRRSIVNILEEEGFNVVGQASTAEEAVALSASSANLYIIDVVMPEVSGIELAKILSEKKMGIYIIMISSLNMEHIIIESISNGALDFLPKPFGRQTLLMAVEKIEKQISEES